jgi:hypothetical protein
MIFDRAMRYSQLRSLLALVLLCASAGLLPLAYASPPDSSWIRGVYDGADFDDVIVLLTSGSAVIDAVLQFSVGRAPLLLGRTTPPDATIGTPPEVAPPQPRAPPTL